MSGQYPSNDRSTRDALRRIFDAAIEAGHPVPDNASVEAGRQVLEAVSGLSPDDLVIALISGGGSATLALPAEALALIDCMGIRISDPVRDALRASESAAPLTGGISYRIIASAAQALEAAATAAVDLGFTPVLLGDSIEGESRELGRAMAATAKSVASQGQPARPPAVLLSGGETTVTIGAEGAGRGGRNTEFLLALALALDGVSGIWALAGDSDGIDGTGDAADAVISPDTLVRARNAGFDARDVLMRHDSYSLFAATGDLVNTGPTLTNVNDIRIVMVRT